MWDLLDLLAPALEMFIHAFRTARSAVERMHILGCLLGILALIAAALSVYWFFNTGGH